MKGLLLLFLLIAVPVSAAPTVTCHCFQNRVFDPAQPAAADPFILATAQNGLLAAAYGIPKSDVVRRKMAGESGEDLWVIHYLASTGAVSPGDVAAAAAQANDWNTAASALKLSAEQFSSRVGAALKERGDTKVMASAVVDTILVERLGAAESDILALRQAVATDSETILAVFLSRRLKRSPLQLLESVRSGQATWGVLVTSASLTPGNLDDAVADLLKSPLPDPAR